MLRGSSSHPPRHPVMSCLLVLSKKASASSSSLVINRFVDTSSKRLFRYRAFLLCHFLQREREKKCKFITQKCISFCRFVGAQRALERQDVHGYVTGLPASRREPQMGSSKVSTSIALTKHLTERRQTRIAVFYVPLPWPRSPSFVGNPPSTET